MFKSTEEAIKYGSKVNNIAWVKKTRTILTCKLTNLTKIEVKDRTLEHWDKISQCNTDIQFCNEAMKSYLNEAGRKRRK